MKLSSSLFVLWAALSVIAACGQPISKKESAAIDALLADASAKHKPGIYLFRNVNLITMTGEGVMEGQSVLVADGKIQSVGTDIQATSATLIDGSGKFLMPGLTDMHVHLFNKHPMKNTWLLLLLLNGVTTVRDMCGEPAKLKLKEKISKNEILGPNLYQSGPIINGVKDKFGLIVAATTPAEGRSLVIDQKKAGYDFIKLYDGLSREVYSAILDEAQRQGILVDGHLPDKVTLTDAITLNQNSIEHLTGYFEWEKRQVVISAPEDYASITGGSTLWNCPTLYSHFLSCSREGVSGVLKYAKSSGLVPKGMQEAWRKRISSQSKAQVAALDKYGVVNFELLKTMATSLHNAKARLLVGTDAGNLPFLIPGYSLHKELGIMHELAIPTDEVLRMATINAAVAMRKDTEFGTVEVGKRADLLLLNANPLDKLDNLRETEGVMVRGIWLSKKDLKDLTDRVKKAFGK